MSKIITTTTAIAAEERVVEKNEEELESLPSSFLLSTTTTTKEQDKGVQVAKVINDKDKAKKINKVKVIVLLFVGLPGSGKSSLARSIYDHYTSTDSNNTDKQKKAAKSTTLCHHIEYDTIEQECLLELQASDNIDDDEILRLKAWKVARQRAIQQLKRALPTSDNMDCYFHWNYSNYAKQTVLPKTTLLILMDDNFHLRSMRKKIHRMLWEIQSKQLERKHQPDEAQQKQVNNTTPTTTDMLNLDIYFGIIHVNTPIDVCKQRNLQRPIKERISDDTINKMYQTIEILKDIDDNTRNDNNDDNSRTSTTIATTATIDNSIKWETTSWLTVDTRAATTTGDDDDDATNIRNADVLQKVLDFIENKCQPIVPVIENNGNEQDEATQKKKEQERIKTSQNLQHNYDKMLRQYVKILCQYDSKKYSKSANMARKQLLQELKMKKNQGSTTTTTTSKKDDSDDGPEELSLLNRFIQRMMVIDDNNNDAAAVDDNDDDAYAKEKERELVLLRQILTTTSLNLN